MSWEDKLREEICLCHKLETYRKNGITRDGGQIAYCILSTGLLSRQPTDCAYVGNFVDVKIGSGLTSSYVPFPKCLLHDEEFQIELDELD